MAQGVRFFDRTDRAAFWAAALASFAVYFATLGPSVGMEDSGELATAADSLGVPHSPGYPFWTLCCWFFCRAFSWVTYMGHPNPAWAVSLFSAVAGALAAGFVAMLLCRSSRDFVAEGGAGELEGWKVGKLESSTSQPSTSQLSTILAFAGGVAGALVFALSPVEWSQSTIVEVYSLNSLFLALVFLLAYRWTRRPSDKVLWLTAFVFGLGLTNYQVLLFAAVPLAFVMALSKAAMFRDVLIYLVPVALTCQTLKIGALDRAMQGMSCDAIAKHVPLDAVERCPSSPALVAAVALLVAALAVAAFLRGRGAHRAAKVAVLAGGSASAVATILACTVFAGANEWSGIYAPVAPLAQPWMYALVALLATVGIVFAALAALDGGRDGARRLRPFPVFLSLSALAGAGAVAAALCFPQADLAGYAGEAYPWTQSTAWLVTLLVALFALCGFAGTRRAYCFAVPVSALQIAVFVLLRRGAMNGLTHPASWWFCWPIAWNFVLLALAWLTLPCGRSVAGAALFAQLGVSFYAYMPIVSDIRNPPMNWAYPRTWEGFKHAVHRGQYGEVDFSVVLQSLKASGVLLSAISRYVRDLWAQFPRVLLPFALVPFAAGPFLVKKGRRLDFWRWVAAVVACLAVTSVFLALLAGVTGSVRDGFVQKVKFISSHQMVAMLVGYGLFFAALLVARLGRRPALAFAALAVALSLALPLAKNRLDGRMVFELGGCEQNGHTFGWQFGAFQLDGAKAIRDFLAADEEPLPDPEWPPAMEKSAILFGGSDPGRFVPTYMIYAADFRPDIYILTQNALADDKYMDVERDLYGDEIWIPSQADCGVAFSRYALEVQAGVRPPAPGMKLVNGRIALNGQVAVFALNDILSRQIFDHEKSRHAFYLEESFPIEWMYEFLSPHGIIMKINPEKPALDGALVAKDRDFWDWYSRRMLKDPAYVRDFMARDTFGRLRASQAALYATRGLMREAAEAYRQAVAMNDSNTPSVIGYARTSLAAERRWDVARAHLDRIAEKDPGSGIAVRMAKEIDSVRKVEDAAGILEAAKKSRRLAPQEMLDLAMHYVSLGRDADAAREVMPLVDYIRDPDVLKFVVECALKAGMDADAGHALSRYLQLYPKRDAKAWATLAKIHHRIGDGERAVGALRVAASLDMELVEMLVQADRELREIAAPFIRKADPDPDGGDGE